MLLKSINYWSFQGGFDGAVSIDSFLAKVKQYGYEAVELCVGATGALTLETTEEECKAYRAQAEGVGLPVASVASGLYWQYALASESAEDRERATAALQQMTRITSWLGAKTLLTIPGAVDVFFQADSPVIAYDTVFERSKNGLAKVIPLAEELGIRPRD